MRATGQGVSWHTMNGLAFPSFSFLGHDICPQGRLGNRIAIYILVFCLPALIGIQQPPLRRRAWDSPNELLVGQLYDSAAYRKSGHQNLGSMVRLEFIPEMNYMNDA